MNAPMMTPRRPARASSGVRLTRRELRVADSQFRATATRTLSEPKPPVSSTPTLQHWLEDRGGWFVLLFCSLSALILTACNSMESQRDPSPQCIDGRVVQQVGRWGPYQTPIVRVTEARCKRAQD
ncbi:hypothetical protein P3W33_17950 [Luteibacter sp. PPL552]